LKIGLNEEIVIHKQDKLKEYKLRQARSRPFIKGLGVKNHP